MQKKLIVTFTAISVLLLSGCESHLMLGQSKVSCDELLVRDGTLSSHMIDFNSIASEAVQKLLDGKNDSILLVTEFVDMRTLANRNKFGFLMTNYLKNNIINSKPNMIIHEINLADSIKVGSEGTKILSQRVDELCKNNTTQAHYAVIGTYTTTPDRIFVSVHLVDLKTQVIEKAYSKDLPMTCEARFLLK